MSNGFCDSRLKPDKLDFDKFTGCVHGQRFDSDPKVLELARVKAEKRSEGSLFTDVLGAVKQNLFRELGTERIRQTI